VRERHKRPAVGAFVSGDGKGALALPMAEPVGVAARDSVACGATARRRGTAAPVVSLRFPRSWLVAGRGS
jgi:hypothetical protein